MATTYGLLSQAFIALGALYKQSDLTPKSDVFTKKFVIDPTMTNTGGDKVEISTQYLTKPMAKDTARDSYGPITNTTGWAERIFQLPNFNLQALVTSKQGERRLPGQTPYSTPDVLGNIIFHISENSAQHVLMIDNSIEKMCIDSLLEGELKFKNNEPMVFGYAPSHKVMPEYFWDSADADPIADLDALIQVLKFDGRSNRFEIWLGEDAFLNYTRNAKVKEHYRDFKAGHLEAVYKDTESNGFVTKLPDIISPRGNTLEIRSYTASYDEFDAEYKRVGSKLFFPSNKVLVVSKDADLRMALGSPSVMPAELLNEIGVPMFPTLEINGGSIVQTVMPQGITGLNVQTFSTQAPVILSPDRVGSLDALLA